jgi:hypothetical protein
VATPLYPRHPERVCWGCNKFCPAAELACGNGTIRTPHPIELLGEDWLEPGDHERERIHRAATSNPIPA